MIKIIQTLLAYFLLVSTSFANTDQISDSVSIIPKNDNVLVEAFKSWYFSFSDLNLYAIYLIDMLSVVAIVVSLLFVIIWWFRCVLAFWSDDKWDWAKKTVIHALMWLAISTLAWVIVELVLKIISA